MIRIKKDRDISILVIAFFVLSFLVFLFIKPPITGMVVSIITPVNIHNINTGNSIADTDTIGLSFSAGDEQPCEATLEVNISNTAGTQIYFGTTTLQTFIGSATPFSACVDSPSKYITSSSATLNSPITIFSGLSSVTFNTAGTYTFTLNFSNSTGLIDMEPKQFTVSDLSSDVKFPQITSVFFKNENGTTSFMKTQYVNCSASVSDSDSTSVTVNYIMYGSNITKTSITNPGKTGTMDCTGMDWSSGKTCFVKTKVERSDLGYWNCTIESNDGINKNYTNSTSILMINSPPTLKEAIENISIEKNENYTDLDLDSHFEDPDDKPLNYSVSGNTNINITIKSNGDVIFTPKSDWTGNETVIFKARDEKGAETSSNNVKLMVGALLNCTSNWTCGNWSACINNNRTRTCTDTNNCAIANPAAVTIEACASSVATCASGDGCMMDCVSGDPDCSCTMQSGFICGPSQNCTVSTLTHSGTGVCCSVACTTSVNTLGKSGSGSGMSSQTSKILIGVGTIAGVVFVVILIIMLSGFINKKKAAVVEEQKIIPDIKPEQKALDFTPIKIKPTNIDKMKDYIEQSLASKVPIRIVKGELTKVGWTESDIDKELNIARLRNYIQIKLNQGIPRAQIEQSLRMKGWSQEQIDEAAKNTKVRPLI